MRPEVESVSAGIQPSTVAVVFKFPDSRPGELARYRVELSVAEAARLQALLLLAIADHANGATR